MIEKGKIGALPKIFSDDEIDAVVERRHKQERIYDVLDVTNVRPAREPTDGLPESTIEQRFQHIAKRLVAYWPSEACALYLDSLIVTQRDARQGFPKEVLEDLLLLHSINDTVRRKVTR